MSSKDEKNRTSLREFITQFLTGASLRLYLSGIVAACVVTGLILGGLTSFQLLGSNKLMDTKTIQFLEMERVGNSLTRLIKSHFQLKSEDGQSLLNDTIAVKDPDMILRITKSGKLRATLGAIDKGTTISSLGFTRRLEMGKIIVVQIKGQNNIGVVATESQVSLIIGELVRPGRYLLLWKADFNQWLRELMPINKSVTTYLASAEGHLIYTSDYTVTPIGLNERPLVGYFIKSALARGQLEIEQEGDILHGQFYAVPDTNIVVFSEVSDSQILSKVNKVELEQITYQAGIVVLTLIVLQLVLQGVLLPLHRVLRAANKISQGEFETGLAVSGVGEIRELTQVVVGTAAKLKDREANLIALAEEKEQKVRLASELEIAANIQQNLLPEEAWPTGLPVEIFGVYQPASEVAGDWYHYYLNELRQEAYFIVADVSGHGAGSAMMTSVIAGIFMDHTKNIGVDNTFDQNRFAESVDHAFKRIGKRKWHVTLTSMVYRFKDHHIKICNSGHVPFFYYSAEAEKVKSIIQPSDPCGLGNNDLVHTKELTLVPGDFMLFYTDCIIETPGAKPAYRSRHIKKFLTNLKDPSAQEIVEGVVRDFRDKVGDVVLEDDLCVLGFHVMS